MTIPSTLLPLFLLLHMWSIRMFSEMGGHRLEAPRSTLSVLLPPSASRGLWHLPSAASSTSLAQSRGAGIARYAFRLALLAFFLGARAA
eukprot:scaffold73_cov252-Pinguiococcus_pyrenoidosus.AAC.31